MHDLRIRREGTRRGYNIARLRSLDDDKALSGLNTNDRTWSHFIMGDESNTNTLSTIPIIRESQSRSRTLQKTLSRLPTGLRVFEPFTLSIQKRQIWVEPYEFTRKFTDPDPGRSRLCYECNTVMNNLHCHPWSNTERAQSQSARRIIMRRQTTDFFTEAFGWWMSVPCAP